MDGVPWLRNTCLLILIMNSMCSDRELYFTNEEALNNIFFSNYTEMLSSVLSLSKCTQLCSLYSGCRSFSYHDGDDSCLLHDVKYTSQGDGEIRNGWRYYTIHIDWPVAYTRVDDSFFKMTYSITEMFPLDARDFCYNNSERMVYIASAHKQQDVTEMSAKAPLVYYIYNYNIYINGVYRNTQYETYEGEVMNYFVWDINEPYNQLLDIYLRFSDKVTGQWETSSGVARRFFICEKVT